MNPAMNKEMTFEQAMQKLEDIIRAMEDPALPLESGLALFKEGTECARLCREMLDKAKHELEVWQNGEAVPIDEAALNQE